MISLCIVARNEAAFIADTIASAQPVVDEVVLVDTGSSDATPSIARAAGATVVHAPWPGDLGAAHNLPLAHAHGDWILGLDGDEVLDPAAHPLIREVAAAGEHDGYRLPVRNYSYVWEAKRRPADPRDPLARGASGYIPTWPVRLFRNHPEHHYTGRLHQCVGPSIRQRGGRIGDVDVPIHHYGFLRVDRAKSPLYRALARQEAADHPDDPRAWVDLGVVLLEENNLISLPAAAQAFRRARSLGDHADAAYLLGSALAELGFPDPAVGFLEESVNANPHDAAGHYDRADAWEALGLAYEDLGERADAEAAYRTAVAARPESPAALHNLASLLVDTGALDQATALLERLLARHRGVAACWSLLGRIRLRQGDPDVAATAFRTALDIHPTSAGARFNLAVAHRRAGRPGTAARAYAAASERLGSVEADRLALATRLPPRHRHRLAPPVDNLGPGSVITVTGSLSGGSGRVVADAVAALAGRPQLVVCEDAGAFTDQGLRAELEAASVTVLPVASDAELGLVLRRARPAIVVHHWSASLLAQAMRIGDARWICVGHAALPMPPGYDAYVVNSAFHRQLQDHLPPQRIRFIPNGVDRQRFPAPMPPPADRPVTIAMLSRLAPSKFPRRLLDYLPALDGAQVRIGGYGSRRHELEPEIAARGLADTVRFVGPVGSASVPAFLAGADIGLHLTETHRELCSMSVLEMLAAGLPVVAEPKGGLPEMVVDGRNGYLATDAVGIADRLRRLIDAPDLRAAMGAASREVAARFDVATFGASLRELVAAVERGDIPEPAAERRAPARAGAAPPPRQCYFVCATPRSGSSLLGDALTGTGLAGAPTELFSVVAVRTLGGRWATPNLSAYVDELQRRVTTPNGVFGAKVHFDGLQRLLDGLGAGAGADRPAHERLAAAFPGLRYVWIRRRDKVAQAVSWERAVQTGAWEHIGAAPPVTIPRPRFDAEAIGQRLDAIERAEQGWAAFFADAGVEPVHVAYEELAADWEATVRRVLAELQIDAPSPHWFARPRLQRQADEESARWIQRFRETAGDRVDADAPTTVTRSAPST